MDRQLIEKFRKEKCTGCPFDCLTTEDVKECMRAYDDFIKDSKQGDNMTSLIEKTYKQYRVEFVDEYGRKGAYFLRGCNVNIENEKFTLISKGYTAIKIREE